MFWIKKIKNLKAENELLKNEIGKQQFKMDLLIVEYEKEIKSNYDKYIKMHNSSKGGYISKIHKLEDKIKELEEQLKESMTDKYLVKKIPSGRPPKQEKMKVKNCTKTSMISKKMHRDK